MLDVVSGCCRRYENDSCQYCSPPVHGSLFAWYSHMFLYMLLLLCLAAAVQLMLLLARDPELFFAAFAGQHAHHEAAAPSSAAGSAGCVKPAAVQCSRRRTGHRSSSSSRAGRGQQHLPRGLPQHLRVPGGVVCGLCAVCGLPRQPLRGCTRCDGCT